MLQAQHKLRNNEVVVYIGFERAFLLKKWMEEEAGLEEMDYRMTEHNFFDNKKDELKNILKNEKAFLVFSCAQLKTLQLKIENQGFNFCFPITWNLIHRPSTISAFFIFMSSMVTVLMEHSSDINLYILRVMLLRETVHNLFYNRHHSDAVHCILSND